ncbi:hypothetical protein DKM44_10605 [Deinococcus irradiatisoli]|uniref:Uncharacterized protein n=1 Tax=Deinococcus irradiatisoli TaxID=2202254 RepID=A0A2Z3JSB6_9DEIO|nr:hypothetical protein [Deinococcus irradiatisoli]AWN23624.1 hypothetical protein DKM44_10605 [Deinococcus irradiatisoli]
MTETAEHTVITREEIAGVEFDWFACDEAGHVAQFLATGDDTVPQAALASEEWLEQLHVYIDTLPEREPVNAPAGGFDAHLAGPQQRGAFVYDAVPGQPGRYRLAALPRTPLKVSEVPEVLRAYLGTLKLKVVFGVEQLHVSPDGVARTLSE